MAPNKGVGPDGGCAVLAGTRSQAVHCRRSKNQQAAYAPASERLRLESCNYLTSLKEIFLPLGQLKDAAERLGWRFNASTAALQRFAGRGAARAGASGTNQFGAGI
ncbi:MAG: hypothetical protein Tsb0016_02290 [Sphingomonadales bacterium]